MQRQRVRRVARDEDKNERANDDSEEEVHARPTKVLKRRADELLELLNASRAALHAKLALDTLVEHTVVVVVGDSCLVRIVRAEIDHELRVEALADAGVHALDHVRDVLEEAERDDQKRRTDDRGGRGDVGLCHDSDAGDTEAGDHEHVVRDVLAHLFTHAALEEVLVCANLVLRGVDALLLALVDEPVEAEHNDNGRAEHGEHDHGKRVEAGVLVILSAEGHVRRVVAHEGAERVHEGEVEHTSDTNNKQQEGLEHAHVLRALLVVRLVARVLVHHRAHLHVLADEVGVDRHRAEHEEQAAEEEVQRGRDHLLVREPARAWPSRCTCRGSLCGGLCGPFR